MNDLPDHLCELCRSVSGSHVCESPTMTTAGEGSRQKNLLGRYEGEAGRWTEESLPPHDGHN